MQISRHAEVALTDPIARLGSVDWDFADAPQSSAIHSLHPYPAKFIPEIPSALIAELSVEGETVADIFCGSGTTLVEALGAGRRAIGIDANPLACLIARAKTCRLVPSIRVALDDTIQRAQQLETRVGSLPLFQQKFSSSHFRPDPKVAEFWFEPFVVEELAELRSYCLALLEPARSVALTAFSSIIVTVSKQDSDTRYVRRDKTIKPGDTCRKFIRSLQQALAAHDALQARHKSQDCAIIDGNVLMEPVTTTFDLLVCSPPYPNAYSYHLYHMTRLLWLEMDHGSFKKQEIGSHRKYSSRGRAAATAATFEEEFSTIMGWTARHLRPYRYACFVVGDSTIRGERINNGDILARVGAAHGLVEVARMKRRLRDTRKAFNPVIGKIKTEDILILQRQR